jgi:hypothetical protein
MAQSMPTIAPTVVAYNMCEAELIDVNKLNITVESVDPMADQ